MSTTTGHVEWKRAEVALTKFKDICSLHLAMLTNHKSAVEKYHRSNDFSALKTEQVKADRTVRQLVDDIAQIRHLRSQMSPVDWLRYDLQVLPLTNEAQKTIAEFEAVCESCCRAAGANATSDLSSLDAEMEHRPLLSQCQQDLIVAKHNPEVYEKLFSDICELNGVMKDMALLVQSQHDVVDTIEGNITRAQDNLHKGSQNLKLTAKMKVAMLPVSGALIGCLAGGPVGLLVGLKVGGAVALGGGILGGVGGHFLRKKINSQIEEHEMTPLDEGQSNAALPEDKKSV